MSQPEWMQKFKEITGKESGEEGKVVTNPIKVEEPEPEPINVEEEEEDAAALFRAAGGGDPPDDDSDGGNSEDAIDEQSPEDGTLTSGMPSTTTGYSSGMPSTTEGSSGMQSTMAGSSTGIHSSTTVSRDEDLRDSDINSTAAAEAARSSFNPGESFITEEVLVDEDGNEVVVDEDGNEIIEEEGQDETEVEEILVDEDGNEVEPEPEAPKSKSRVVDYSAENYVEEKPKPRGITYKVDLEDQRRILGIGQKKTRKSRFSWCVPLILIALVTAAVLLVVFYVFYGEKPNYGAPTLAPTSTEFQQNANDAAATTVYGPYRNSCPVNTNARQPNFLDQCNCNGSVDILADDIRERWAYYVQTFIPEVYPDWDESIDSCSAKNQALLWLSSGINNGGEISSLLRQQRFLLAVVFFQQGGIKWDRTTNWLSAKDVCTWEGVGCNADNYVDILNLDENNMVGEFSDAPAKLNAIAAYYASNNKLTGTLPSAYFNSTTLVYVDFSINELSGEFPTAISNKTKLFAINVGSNNLEGDFPTEIGQVSGLKIFNIESNGFQGSVPTQLYNLNLTDFLIGGNEFTGTVPGNLPEVPTLTSISLGPNLFEGEIPSNIAWLTNLTKLSLEGIPLTGKLPINYATNLTKLVELSIADTLIGGDIPVQFTTMSNLDVLRLSGNNLRGDIPTEFGFMTNLKSLSLDGNVLTGPIASELGYMSSLEVLELSGNEIYGTIPENFADLVNIQTLTLDNTFMDGRVPDELCDLRDADLTKFVVDCPTLVGDSAVDGIICSVPDCCTKCV